MLIIISNNFCKKIHKSINAENIFTQVRNGGWRRRCFNQNQQKNEEAGKQAHTYTRTNYSVSRNVDTSNGLTADRPTFQKLMPSPEMFYYHADGRRAVGFSLASVCLSVYRHDISKHRCSWDHQTWHTNVPRWVLETIYFRVKNGQKSRSRVTKNVLTWANELVCVGFF